MSLWLPDHNDTALLGCTHNSQSLTSFTKTDLTDGPYYVLYTVYNRLLFTWTEHNFSEKHCLMVSHSIKEVQNNISVLLGAHNLIISHSYLNYSQGSREQWSNNPLLVAVSADLFVFSVLWITCIDTFTVYCRPVSFCTEALNLPLFVEYFSNQSWSSY